MSESFYSIDPEVLGGTPVFSGTRVPIKALFDNLSCGETVEQFLENYPGVRPDQVQQCLDQASSQFDGDNEAAASRATAKIAVEPVYLRYLCKHCAV